MSNKEVWQGIGFWCGVVGLQLATTFVVFYCFGKYGAFLWWILFLGGFYLFYKFNGRK
jgi:hypothetical protein